MKLKVSLTLIVTLGVLLLLATPTGAQMNIDQNKPGLGLIPSVGNFPKLDLSRLKISPKTLPAAVDLSFFKRK